MIDFLFVAWRTRDPNHPGWGPVGRLEFDGVLYRFFYTQGAKTLSGFEPFAGMDDLNEVYTSEEIPPLFKNRLLSEKRPEYEAYLTWGGFDYRNPPDPLTLLAVTEGRRQTDAVEVFPCPSPDAEGCYFNRFFLHGIRWAEPAGRTYIEGRMQAGEELLLIPEPTNAHDPNAVAIYPQGESVRIGYAPRYLAHDIDALLGQCDDGFVKLTVSRINSNAPLQQRVLCQLRGCWPEGFEPCKSEAFLPLLSGVVVDC